ncbi:MAG: cell division protein ZapA [Paludibacter sp.]|jgi:cell division protein ZapA (FtsZ GTPase activity inhibitor)
MKDDKFTINVQISGLRMPLNIPRKDEELYRKAEKMVNTYLNQFQKLYNQRPSEEILIMVAFQIAVIVSKQELNEDKVPLAEKIMELDEELKQLLSNK